MPEALLAKMEVANRTGVGALVDKQFDAAIGKILMPRSGFGRPLFTPPIKLPFSDPGSWEG